MKHAKKIMALVIAMVMVVAMAMPALATTAGGGDTPAATEYDHPLKVTGLERMMSLIFIRLLSGLARQMAM